MSPQTLRISMPAELYSRLKQCADVTQRSIEEELVELLTGALADHTVPRDLAETAASLSSLDDARLWQVAHRNSHSDPPPNKKASAMPPGFMAPPERQS